jgi:hypothetical protein
MNALWIVVAAIVGSTLGCILAPTPAKAVSKARGERVDPRTR